MTYSLHSPMQSKSEKSEPKHFLKVILPSAIHGKQLRIPEEFIRRFGNELSTVATITVPDSCVWKMELKKCGDDVWFCNGWQEFAKYYSISYGAFLVFKYEGNSNFHVLIFDITAAEIFYPCKIPDTNAEPNLDNNSHSKCPRKRSRPDYQQHSYETRSKKHRQENQVEIIDVDNVNLPSQGKSRKKERYNSHGKQNKSQCNQNHTSGMSNSSSKMESFRRKQRAINAAQKFKPKNPSFTVIIKPYVRYKYVYVPAAFAGKYLKLKVPMKLQNYNGQQWDVSCCTQTSTSAAMQIAKGWPAFVRDNHLSAGDVCVFELIKRKQVVLKVRVFRAS